MPDPDVGTPPPEQMPTPRPDMVPPPAPSPSGPPVMAAAKLVLLAGLVVAGLAPRSAWTQAEQSPLSQTAPPEVQDGRPVGTPEGGGGSLSEELSQSEGVIEPSPEAATTDPGIIQPTPDAGAGAGAGTMHVIPPSGSPGGDPNVRPQ